MRTLILLTIAFLSLDATAAPRRRAAAAPIDPEAVSISFIPEMGMAKANDALLDVGTFARGGRTRSARIVKNVGIRVDRRSGSLGGTASLRALLVGGDGNAVFRVDGITLTAAPRVIDSFAPIGTAVMHRIEIEVPPHTAEGAVAGEIVWEVSTN